MEKLKYFQSFIPFYVFIFIVSLQPINLLTAQNPINDSPCMTNSNPPYDLGMAGAHTGTTCNAIGYNDDPNADIQNAQCSAISDDNAVWYRAEYNPSFDGVNINVTAGSIGDNVSVEVYVGDENGMCSGNNEFRRSKCDGLPVINMHIGCLDTFDYVFIKVASSDNDCGTFNVTVSQVNDCNIANECSDITNAQTFNPVTP
ncbi:MAG TPA: hypothetical protein ENK91_04295, partial [Bacteroidetes bacterium]|nr:hypothetical protein [Bacteroidota bacterium]